MSAWQGVWDGAPPIISGNADIYFPRFGLIIDWFPDPPGGWHVGTLLGLGGLALRNGIGADSTGGTVTGSLFFGYDIWMVRRTWLGFMFVSAATPAVGLRDDQGDTGIRFAPLSIALEVTLAYH
jgi:hypothetical protein